MKIKNKYQPRPIRFVELFEVENWTIKIYSISIVNELVSAENLHHAKANLQAWLEKSKAYDLETYNIATLILHEGKEGCFAIINWWIDDNMLQNFVYLKPNGENEYRLYSQDGMATCVWEMEIWWHERNAWVKHVLMKNEKPDFESYLKEQL